MSYFKAKMHQIRFRLGLRPRPCWGAYSAPPDPLAGFKGPTSKGRGGEGTGREGRTREGRGMGPEGRGEGGKGKGEGIGEGEGGEGEWVSPTHYFGLKVALGCRLSIQSQKVCLMDNLQVAYVPRHLTTQRAQRKIAIKLAQIVQRNNELVQFSFCKFTEMSTWRLVTSTLCSSTSTGTSTSKLYLSTSTKYCVHLCL